MSRFLIAILGSTIRLQRTRIILDITLTIALDCTTIHYHSITLGIVISGVYYRT